MAYSGVLNCDPSDHEMMFLFIDERVTQSNPSNHVRKFHCSKRVVKFISNINFNFFNNTSCVDEDC